MIGGELDRGNAGYDGPPMSPASLIKVARPGFWPTHLWFFLLPLGQREMFGRLGFWLGCAYVCFPLGLLLYGWNDLLDAETDRRNDRKDSWLFGARLDDQGLRRLPLWIAISQLPFLAVFAVLFGAKMLLWFAALVAANAVYNWPRLGWKNWPVLDLLNQVGYLLVFVLSSWLCQVPQLSTPALCSAGSSPCSATSSVRSWTSTPIGPPAATPPPA